MNSKDLYRAINSIDDDILKESETAADGRKMKTGWQRAGALAACVSLVIAGAVMWKHIRPPHTEEPEPGYSENGVTIPPMKVSLSANESADMLGFFIYQGRCYMRDGWLDGAADIVGEYLGTATGLIDEWTPKDGYVELAGTVGGDFYAVKGYDPAFMLCMKGSTDDISTYICNNGITLKYGSELYEDRLHLSGHIASVQYESRSSWYFSQNERYQMNSVNDIVLDCIRDMDAARFVLSDAVPLDKEPDSIRDTEWCLYCRLENGMTVRLGVFEKGYVEFWGMPGVCVQISEAHYRALLRLLENHTDSTAVEVTETADETP